LSTHVFLRAQSKFLVPLSYASMLGGACTLIGTSTNLIIEGAAQEF
jgi:di/tricarboxylate transporter